MRLPEIWDAWAEYDDFGISGIREDAPEEVKEAYAKYVAEREKEAQNGLIAK